MSKPGYTPTSSAQTSSPRHATVLRPTKRRQNPASAPSNCHHKDESRCTRINCAAKPLVKQESTWTYVDLPSLLGLRQKSWHTTLGRYMKRFFITGLIKLLIIICLTQASVMVIIFTSLSLIRGNLSDWAYSLVEPYIVRFILGTHSAEPTPTLGEVSVLQVLWATMSVLVQIDGGISGTQSFLDDLRAKVLVGMYAIVGFVCALIVR